MKAAILMTCFNRRETTLKCLKNLYGQNVDFDVFLVDDGSTDGTGQSVKENFPEVQVIQGTGALYWNGGMRLSWLTALEHKNDYDSFIWLNDDTVLDRFAIKKLVACYDDILEASNEQVIVTGACRADAEGTDHFSYGGRDANGPVIPNGDIQQCRYVNGNIVLIPHGIYNKIGVLSPDYTHAHGDYDYGIRAIKAGFKCFTTRDYIATCPPNIGLPKWCDPEVPLKERLKLANSPKGFALDDYAKYKYVDKGFLISKIVYLKIYFRAFLPKFYLWLKRAE